MRNSVFFLIFTVMILFTSQAFSQNRAGRTPPVKNPEAAALADDLTKDIPSAPAETPSAEPISEEPKSADTEMKFETILELAQKGGFLMWPIGIFSVLVLGFGIERFVMLRACFVAPKRFFERLDALAVEKADPRKIYNTCRQFPSAAANIVEKTLISVGRPMSEVQAVIQEAKNNEADKLFGNVRFLILAATVSPLIGLLGTVVGMIESFRLTSLMSTVAAAGANKSELLAGGIYVALITTFAGLAVAIPAAILAHWYEGRISKRFRLIDQKLLRFIVYMTEVEGKVHVTPEQYQTYYESAKALSVKGPMMPKDVKSPGDLKIPADIRKPEGGKGV